MPIINKIYHNNISTNQTASPLVNSTVSPLLSSVASPSVSCPAGCVAVKETFTGLGKTRTLVSVIFALIIVLIFLIYKQTCGVEHVDFDIASLLSSSDPIDKLIFMAKQCDAI